MFKKIIILSLFLIFAKFTFSQEMAIASYNAPFYPYDETVTEEPMLATPIIIDETQTDMAVRASIQSNDYADYTATEHVYMFYPYETTKDPVIRDFRDYDKVYEPEPKITSAGDVKSSHPIRDFRSDYWRNKYYRDEWHNQELYKASYKGYNYYNN